MKFRFACLFVSFVLFANADIQAQTRELSRISVKGVKAFIRLSVMTGGMLIGSAGLWMLNKFMHWWTPKSALVSGAGIGLLSGYLLSILIFFFLRKLAIYIKQLRIDKSILNGGLKF